MNHYETLALKPSASNQDIHNAYRKLSIKFNPEHNDNDFFEPMFTEIQEAFDTLSDDIKRKEYDQIKNLNQVFTETEVIENTNPKVLYFQSDQEDFEEGEKIVLSWETQNSDEVILKPFGPVPPKGIKTFKLKNISKQELTFTLQVTNSTSGKTTQEILKLKNRVPEIDFSEFEEEKPIERTLETKKVISNEEVLSQHETTTSKEDQEKARPEAAKQEELLKKQASTIQANSLSGAATMASTIYSENFFSTEGRLRRSTYFLRSFLIGISAFVLISIIGEISVYNEGTLAILYISYIFLIIMGWIQTVKRCHDLNQSGWISLLYIIPLVNIGLGLYHVFAEGTRGENKYGPDPKNRTQY